MHTLFVLLDGAEDHDIPAFNGKRPLDVAEMPFMASAAKNKAYTSGRDYTHLFLNEFLTGHPPELPRAVIEALGLNMNVSGNRTAYRLSPAYIRSGMVEWAYNMDELHESLTACVRRHLRVLDDLDPEIEFFLNGRAILTMNCDDVPDLPSPPVPAPYKEVPGVLGDIVNSVAKEMNGLTVYPWGCGRFTDQKKMYDCMGRLVTISDSPTALGISASLGQGYEMIKNIDDRFPAAVKALDDSNVLLHMDEVDEYSHQKDPQKKVRILEHIDVMMEKYFSDTERIVYFVDHGTSSITGEHLPVKVPFWTSFRTSVADGENVALKNVIPRIMEDRQNIL
ncbi:MAG: phosphoglycerate mutase [Methanomassiliicoccaceae archaeon]|nr:phosphoglycerate mutase [Methanomassiliicoccaceae archaeon]